MNATRPEKRAARQRGSTIRQEARRTSAGPALIKVGGSLLDAPEKLPALAAALARERASGPLVIVHGGGKRVSEISRRAGLVPRFESGLRVTDDATLEIVLMVLAGLVNKSLVAALRSAGLNAVGLSGGDGGMVTARPIGDIGGVAMGNVGRIDSVDTGLIESLLASGFVPVIATIALDAEKPGWLNVNADPMASELAVALGASRLIFWTDVPGVLGGDGEPLSRLTVDETRGLIASGAVSGGMKPKLEASCHALARGVKEVVIGPAARPSGAADISDGTRLSA